MFHLYVQLYICFKFQVSWFSVYMYLHAISSKKKWLSVYMYLHAISSQNFIHPLKPGPISYIYAGLSILMIYPAFYNLC